MTTIKLALLCEDVYAPDVRGWDLYGERADDGFLTLLLQGPDGRFKADDDPDAWGHYNPDLTQDQQDRLMTRANELARAINDGFIDPEIIFTTSTRRR